MRILKWNLNNKLLYLETIFRDEGESRKKVILYLPEGKWLHWPRPPICLRLCQHADATEEHSDLGYL